MNAKTSTAWDFLARPPQSALKQIKGGRLSGMTDINPQWRYKAMHDVYGPCGIGWKYSIDRTWTEQGANGQVFMFAQVSVAIKSGEEWSDSIPGIGGSMLLETQKGSLHHNDEAVKMAVTDALSVALKMLGVGADVYMGRWDGSKYKDSNEELQKNEAEALAKKASEMKVTPTAGAADRISTEQLTKIDGIAEEINHLFSIGEIGKMVVVRNQVTDADEFAYLASLLPSQVKTAIKKAKESAKVADSVAAQS